MSGDQFHLGVTPPFRERLERLAAERKTTLAAAVTAAAREATKGTGAVLTEQEILDLLSEAARDGNVSAMRELRAYHRERERADPDGLGLFDELAARRPAH